MATEDWMAQFRANQELIARVSGIRNPLFDMEVKVEDRQWSVIADCGHIVSQREYDRNNGWCDNCSMKGDLNGA